jgi:hypothetical protein
MQPHVRNYSEFRNYMKGRSLYGAEEEEYTTSSEPQNATAETDVGSVDSPQVTGGTEVKGLGISNHGENETSSNGGII